VPISRNWGEMMAVLLVVCAHLIWALRELDAAEDVLNIENPSTIK